MKKGVAVAVQRNRSLTLEQVHSPPRPRMGLKPVGRRLADVLRGGERQELGPLGGSQEVWRRDGRGEAGTEVLSRFPFARHGYDCSSVDEYIAQLEEDCAALGQELAEMRAGTGPREEVANEIKRIGEQTSSVLIAAHEQREALLRVAREEADRCVADAKAQANAATADVEVRLREVEAQSDSVHRERDRLLEDVRTVSAALAAVADSAYERIPANP